MSFSSFAKKACPWIATAVSIAVPGAAPFANLAAKALSDGLGKDVKADPDSISSAITEAMASPDQLAKLKTIDDQFAAQMKALDIQNLDALTQIAEQDTASAREREESVRDWMPRFLGTGIVSAFLTAVFLILTGHAKADSVMAGTLIGYLSAKAEQVVVYYFGSSAGSERKTELLAQAPAIPQK
jgi:hypothetical protein